MSVTERELASRYMDGVRLGMVSPFEEDVETNCQAQRTPICILFHGAGEHLSDWLTGTKIEQTAKDSQVLFLMPEFIGSTLCDGSEGLMDGWYYQTIHEMMPFLHTIFPYTRDRTFVSIGGFSAGAGQSAIVGLNHPEYFHHVYSLAGVFPDFEHIEEDGAAERKRKRIEAAGGLTQFLKTPENIWGRLPELAKHPDFPRWSIICGTDDPNYRHSRAIEERALTCGVPVACRYYPALTHDLAFCDKAISELFERQA